jgi:hypothetical protein
MLQKFLKRYCTVTAVIPIAWLLFEILTYNNLEYEDLKISIFLFILIPIMIPWMGGVVWMYSDIAINIANKKLRMRWLQFAILFNIITLIIYLYRRDTLTRKSTS